MARMRSPNYPSCGLDGAVSMARKIWDKDKRTTLSMEQAAHDVGYSGLSGPARTSIAALRKYGLLEDAKDGMRLSDLALRILHPANDDERLEALREAALKPELFRQVYESHRDANNKTLESYLINKLGFSDVGAKGFVDSFRETVGFANLSETGYSEPVETQEKQAMNTSIPVPPRHNNYEIKAAALSFTWPLSKDLVAEVRFTNHDVRPEHIDRLTKYLELVKGALAADETT